VTGLWRAASFRTRTPLQYHLTIEDGKIMTSGRTEGAFVLQDHSLFSHRWPARSDQCVIGGGSHLVPHGEGAHQQSVRGKVYGVAVFEGEPARSQPCRWTLSGQERHTTPLWDRTTRP
jgi:hypothetical protein